jgi:serine/threonine protein kinase
MPQSFEQLGPYKLGKKLGQGGMGTVFEGTDIETGQPVAVKVLAPAMAAEEGFRGRFEAEIESLKKLRHANIVRLFGYGEQDGSMFYAMELVDGTNLEEEIRQGRRYDWREVTQIAIKICKALKHAHDHGIVHRDIKPANLLVAHDGEIKLSDFGIARLFGNTRMTSDGGVLGTAEYMAPEQANGRGVTDRCDQYSLGGVMYALLAGRPPFRANTFVEMLQMQQFSEPQPVRRFAPDTPAELDRIIAQLLAKDPSKRFSNTTMLARALEAMEKGLSLSSARNDFVIADPSRTAQSHLTGLDPYAATLVPSDEPSVIEGYSIAPDHTEVPLQTLKPALTSSPPADVPATKRFTKVEAEPDHKTSSLTERLRQLFSPQLLGLVLALVLVAGLAAYLLQPVGADELYRRVTATVKDGSLPRLREAAPAIKEFLDRFADDPRATELAEYQEKLDLDRRGRNAQLHSRKLGKLAEQSPIERTYLEAIALSATNPEVAIAKLQAIVDLYNDPTVTANDGAEFVVVARHDLERLKQQLAASTAVQLKLLEARANKASELASADPAAATRLWQSIVELYGDKPWAAEVVSRARQALSATPEKSAEAQQSTP